LLKDIGAEINGQNLSAAKMICVKGKYMTALFRDLFMSQR